MLLLTTAPAGMPRVVMGSLFPLQKLKPSRIPRLSFNGANTFAKTFTRLEVATKASLGQPGSKFRDAYSGSSVWTVFGPSF